MAIFDHTHPKIIESTFSFPEFVPAWKKWLYSICSFLSPVTRLTKSTFEHALPKKFLISFLIFVIMYQHAKISLMFHQFIFQIQSILESNHQTGHTHFFDHVHLKNVQSSFNLCETVPVCKKAISSISSFLWYSQF